MGRIDKLLIATIFMFVGIFFGMIFGAYLCRNDYRQGQIDVLTNKVKYELRVNSDSTKTWHKKGQ